MTSEDNKKKKTSSLKMFGWLIFFFFAIFILVFMIDRIAFVARNHELPLISYSKDYFVELQVPKSWSVTIDNSRNNWLTVQSRDKKTNIKIYAFKLNRRISIDEFLKYGYKLFPKVGSPIETKKVELPFWRKFFGNPYDGIDKIYKIRGNSKLLIRYVTSSTYAYAIVASNASGDPKPLQKLLDYDLTILNKNVIYADIKNILNNNHEIMIWISGAAGAFAFWIGIGFLCKSGWFIRTAIGNINALRDVQAEAIKTNQTLTKKYYRVRLKTRATIWLIIGTWMAFYVIVFYIFGKEAFKLCLLLIFPLIGFVGFKIGPSDDPNDWAH